MNPATVNKYCVVCGKEWGPGLTRCCTRDGLLAIRRSGLPGSRSEYFTLDGRPVHEEELSALRELALAGGGFPGAASVKAGELEREESGAEAHLGQPIRESGASRAEPAYGPESLAGPAKEVVPEQGGARKAVKRPPSPAIGKVAPVVITLLLCAIGIAINEGLLSRLIPTIRSIPALLRGAEGIGAIMCLAGWLTKHRALVGLGGLIILGTLVFETAAFLYYRG